MCKNSDMRLNVNVNGNSTEQALQNPTSVKQTSARGSKASPGQTTLPSRSNIRLRPTKPCAFGVDMFTSGRVRLTGSLRPNEVRLVDGSIYTVWETSMGCIHQWKEKVLNPGGDPIMESRTYGLLKIAEVLGNIVPNTSPRTRKEGHGICK